MASCAELVDQLPIDDIARTLGIDPQQAMEAVSAVVPALIGGMQANAADPAGAASLTKALGDHAGQSISSVDEVDVEDGEKIVRHVFGDQSDQVVQQLGGLGLGSGLISKLLPMLAPFILSWLGSRIFGGGGRQQAPQPRQAPQQQNEGGGLLDGIMDKVLGRDKAPAPQAPAQVPAPTQVPAPGQGGGVDIGSILNDMLGGGGGGSQSRGGSGGAAPGGMGLDDLLGGVLGGLLGGGRR